TTDPAGLFKDVTIEGLVWQPGQTLVVPAGVNLVLNHLYFRGPTEPIEDHVQCAGSIIVAESDHVTEGLFLNEGLTVTGDGVVDLGDGELCVRNMVSGSGGQSVRAERIRIGEGGDGKFVQTAGEVGAWIGVYVGSLSGQGLYELHDGLLWSPWTYLGDGGPGRIVQTGGTHSVGTELYVGYSAAVPETCVYELSGTGRLEANNEYLGFGGTGEFNQIAGTNVVLKSLWVGYHMGSKGTYTQTGGEVSVGDRLTVGWDYGSTGAYVQNGGTVTAGDQVWLGHYAGSTGRYELRGDGELTTGYLRVGYMGAGSFLHESGTVAVGYVLYVGNRTDGVGTYELKGGTLTADLGEFVGGGSGTAGDGVFIQTGGSNTALWVTMARDATGHGEYTLSDGTLTATETLTIGSLGTATFTQTGGAVRAATIDIGRDSNAHGTFGLEGGSVDVDMLTVGRNAYGTWNLLDPAAMVQVRQWLRFGPKGTFSAVAGSTVHMMGAALENQRTDPAALAGLAQTTLIIEGGPEAPSRLEAASADLGLDPAGWTDNFAIGRLVLGGAAAGWIELADDWDNQLDGSGGEAVYVGELVLNGGAAVSLGDIPLYYLKDALPRRLWVADANLDGQVGIADLVSLAEHYGLSSGADWACGDFNGDGLVGIADLVALADHYGDGSGAAQNVPEPAAMLLLALGAGAVAARRRRPRAA
ncbi:MAG TPA: PEP-CTERM sorting domain-containing protein, partial [Phycisphaerae bacterium]|nr:PEP-CTERM sorting domain-containing protein [Phycisphaerae bacterium]